MGRGGSNSRRAFLLDNDESCSGHSSQPDSLPQRHGGDDHAENPGHDRAIFLDAQQQTQDARYQTEHLRLPALSEQRQQKRQEDDQNGSYGEGGHRKGSRGSAAIRSRRD